MFACVCVTLQALCTAVTEQNLLKTVTQIFAEAEAVRLADANGNDKRVSPHYSYTQSAGMIESVPVLQPCFLKVKFVI